MIAKINELKSNTASQDVKTLCETAISAISSAIYNGVTPEARVEIERVAAENLFEGLSKYKDKSIVEWLSTQKRLYSLKNIGVRKAVNILIESEGKYNPTLCEILDVYKDRLNEDVNEVLLYEDFVNSLDNFNYIPAVAAQVNYINATAKKYNVDLAITKIIESMKLSRSNYLIPLIEDVVNNYLNDKNEQNRHVLKETLVKFNYDDSVRTLINLLSVDATSLQLEYANGETTIEKVYSPVMYLGKNEAVFCINESYYVKKGNNINKLKKAEIQLLDPKFRRLCETFNRPEVEFDKKWIKIFIGNDKAVINESAVIVNDKEMSTAEFAEAVSVSGWYGNTLFYGLTETLVENFNEIAEIDFVKRVCLLENEKVAADIFKLRDNIFITTFDPINNKSTFYRNINPIQAEKIMIEHMKFDVSKTFAEILPNKEKILNEIDETKHSYNDYTRDLEKKIAKFKINPYGQKVNTEVIEALQEELDDIKNEYKDYLNEVEKYTSVAESLTITVKDDESGNTHTVQIPDESLASSGTEGQFGSEVGAENVDGLADEQPAEPGILDPLAGGGDAASAITFRDAETEMGGDEPSIDADTVDLDSDELEADADELQATKDIEEPEDSEAAEESPIEEPGAESPETAVDLGGDTSMDSTEPELDLTGEPGAETTEEPAEEEPAEPAEEEPAEEEPKKKKVKPLEDSADPTEKMEKVPDISDVPVKKAPPAVKKPAPVKDKTDDQEYKMPKEKTKKRVFLIKKNKPEEKD